MKSSARNEGIGPPRPNLSVQGTVSPPASDELQRPIASFGLLRPLLKRSGLATDDCRAWTRPVDGRLLPASVSCNHPKRGACHGRLGRCGAGTLESSVTVGDPDRSITGQLSL